MSLTQQGLHQQDDTNYDSHNAELEIAYHMIGVAKVIKVNKNCSRKQQKTSLVQLK